MVAGQGDRDPGRLKQQTKIGKLAEIGRREYQRSKYPGHAA
jgi:hypothetical protein